MGLNRIKELFLKIKKAREFWLVGDVAFKQRIERALEPTFIQLENLGVNRYFSEALLFWGEEFTDSLDSTSDIPPACQGETNIKEAELIYGSKAYVPTEDKVIRENNLAQKYGALAFEPLKTNTDKASIRVLTYKEK